MELQKELEALVADEIAREREEKDGLFRRDGGRKAAIGHIALKILQSINRDLSADRTRIEYLETINGTYTGRVILRMSSTERGFRLHETSREGSERTVREAIDKHMREHPELVEKILP